MIGFLLVATAGTIANEQRMLQQQRFRSDGADPTWLEESRKGDQQMDGENEEVAHRQNRTATISARKTARHGRIPSYYDFAPTHRNGSRVFDPHRSAGCV